MRLAIASRSTSLGSVWMTTSAPGAISWRPGFDLLGNGVGPFERQVAVDIDGHVHEKHGPGAANPHLPHVEHAFDPGGLIAETLRQAVGRAVEEHVDRPPAQPIAHKQDDEGNAERG